MKTHHTSERFFFLMILLIVFGCGKDAHKPEFDFDDRDIEERSISFEDLKGSVLVPHCTRCHSEFLHEEGVRNVIYPQHPELSHLYLHMEDGSMPTSGEKVDAAGLELTWQYIEKLPQGRPGKRNADDYFPWLPRG